MAKKRFSLYRNECLSACHAVLQKEDELSLAFIHGQWPHEFSTDEQLRPRFQGWPLRVLIHLRRLVRDLIATRKKYANWENKSAAKWYLFFAGTFNQYNALRPSAIELSLISPGTIFLHTGRIDDAVDCPANSARVSFLCRDVLLSLALSLSRLRKLWKQLISINVRLLSWRLDTFLETHLWLVYAWFTLAEIKPKFLIVSNDHNTANRCLIAMAHHLGVKTVYLQHASVSHIFPALRFNVAFLDGRAALGRYFECEQNSPGSVQEYPSPIIFLSGQKKAVSCDSKTCLSTIALAINTEDELQVVIAFSIRLLDDGKHIIIRWHPAQSHHYVQALKDALEAYAGLVLFSDPLKQSLGEYFSHAQVMVSGNSSIHLEAALGGLRTIYYEWRDIDCYSNLNSFVRDYYGYVKAGLSDGANTVDDVMALCKKYSKELRQPDKRLSAIKYYSETFGTQWEGREGELVARTLMAIDGSESDFGDFVPIKDDVFSEVWALK
jgi:hypothetical protein